MLNIHEVGMASSWEFVREQFRKGNLWEETVHGGLHISAVREYASLMGGFLLDQRLAELVILAAELHDLGRLGEGYKCTGVSDKEHEAAVKASRIDQDNPAYVDHANLSAELIRLMAFPELSDDEREALIFAVRNHSKGLVGLEIESPRTLREMILGLLCIADHCGDAASPSGYARAAESMRRAGKPVLLPEGSQFSVDFLRSVMEGEDFPFGLMQAAKGESLISHLVYNLAASGPMIEACRDILPEEFFKEMFHLQESRYRECIIPLLSAQEQINELRQK